MKLSRNKNSTSKDNDNKTIKSLLYSLKELLIKEGHRQIIGTDLMQVIIDAIDQQIQWFGIQDKENFLGNGKDIIESLFDNIESIDNSNSTIPKDEELNLIQEIDRVINSLYTLKAFKKKDLQDKILEIKESLEKIKQDIWKCSQIQNTKIDKQLKKITKLYYLFDQIDSEPKKYNKVRYQLKKTLERLRCNSLEKSLSKCHSLSLSQDTINKIHNFIENNSDWRGNLSRKFHNFSQQQLNEIANIIEQSYDESKKFFKGIFDRYFDDLSNQNLIEITNLIWFSSAQISDEELSDLLSRILTASKGELRAIKSQKINDENPLSAIVEIEDKLKAINIKIRSILDTIASSKRDTVSKYSYKIGDLDPAITMWTAIELAENSLAKLTTEQQEDYFQNLYRVSQEQLGKDVPLVVRSRWLRKGALIMRDILVSWQGEKIKANPVYILFNFVLSIYNQLKPNIRFFNIVLIVLLFLSFVMLGIIFFTNKISLIVIIAISVIAIFVSFILLLKLLDWLFNLILDD